MVAGVDEAGRGAVVGPLVVAGVCIVEEKLSRLVEIGVKDSKLLSPYGRRRLYGEVLKIVDKHFVWKISPREIDRYVIEGRKFRRLNYLEALAMARVIEELHPDIVYVDASDTEPLRFKAQVESALRRRVEIISTHKADRLFPVVSAASIIAKVERDDEIEKLKAQVGDFGSGYPSDPRTRSFLSEWLKKHGSTPDFTRRSWKMWRKISSMKIEDFSKVMDSSI